MQETNVDISSEVYLTAVLSTDSSLCGSGTGINLNWLVKPIKNSFTLKNGDTISLPLFQSDDLNVLGNYDITSALIIQHGNLRNGNDYYCDAIQTQINGLSNQYSINQGLLVIGTQFYTPGDVCWDSESKQSYIIDALDRSTWCGLQIFTSEGWKDGHASIDTTLSTPFYSYDVFNVLIDRLSDKAYFPLLTNITLFGFSAGAQVVLRYAAYPKYQVNSSVDVQYIISDPSTYLYYDRRRPVVSTASQSADLFTTMFGGDALANLYEHPYHQHLNWVSKNDSYVEGFFTTAHHKPPLIPWVSRPPPTRRVSVSFDYPDPSWQAWTLWRANTSGLPWITDWDRDKCAGFNDFRYIMPPNAYM